MSEMKASLDPQLAESGEIAKLVEEKQRRSVRFAEGSELLITESQRSHHSRDSITESQRSNRSAGSGSSAGLRAGESLRSNLMREQKDRDPLYFYEVLRVVGVGSMGSVATVKKRDSVIGGSARQSLVKSLATQKKEKECFSIPVFGPLFMFCMKGTFDHSKLADSYHANVTKKDLFESTNSAQSEATGSTDDDLTSSSRSRGNMVYAMKSIHLNRVKDPTFVEELRNEIEILKKLDHPHIVRPIETFHHRNQVFIVMELCSGGDLYSRDPYTEEEAARITSSILSAISYMHSKEIAHRDLKYENVLFVNDSPYAEIKLIDFGLSKKYIGGQNLTDGVGTIYTMAPEVLKGSYTQAADIWSIGVITYMLLSSQMPFYGRKRRHIVEQIMKGQYDFRGRRWKRISEQAKSFVEDLLVMDPDDRPTAAEASSSMWLNKRYGATTRAPTMDEVSQSNKSLKAFAGYSKLKKLSLMVIAHKSTSEEIGVLRKLFQQYDTLKNGNLSFEEFKEAMEQYGHSEDEIEEMFDAADLDGTGKIRYTEFLAATIEAVGAISEERLAEAFDRLDSDDSGYISAANLAEMLGADFPKEEIDEIIQEADLTNDNRISYSEFLALWETKNEEKRDILFQEIKPSFNTSSSLGLDSDSDVYMSNRSIKSDMEEDNVKENHTLARANYLEGKHVSERRHHEIVAGGEGAKKVLFAGAEEIPDPPAAVSPLPPYEDDPSAI